MPVVAEQGFAEFSLDDIADRADVTRNLLYHYFPRGRSDVAIAVAEAAGHQLTDEWITDEAIPLAERLVANNGRMIEHAMGPTDAWTLYQRARGSNDAELRETMDRFVYVVVSAILLNHFGPAEAAAAGARRAQGLPGLLRRRSRRGTLTSGTPSGAGSCRSSPPRSPRRWRATRDRKAPLRGPSAW